MLSKKAIIFFFVILILMIASVFVFFMSKESTEKSAPKETDEISLQKKQQIEDWIQENNLNQYGDANDTVYIGGTPLFDEATSQSTDKYEYILQGHPDRPWKK